MTRVGELRRRRSAHLVFFLVTLPICTSCLANVVSFECSDKFVSFTFFWDKKANNARDEERSRMQWEELLSRQAVRKIVFTVIEDANIECRVFSFDRNEYIEANCTKDTIYIRRPSTSYENTRTEYLGTEINRSSGVLAGC